MQEKVQVGVLPGVEPGLVYYVGAAATVTDAMGSGLLHAAIFRQRLRSRRLVDW